jgi:hypothetical protein
MMDVNDVKNEPDSMINIRDLSIRCGRCGTYQTLASYEPGDGYNIYTYECDNDACRPEQSRTLVEVPVVLDLFARRHPESGCDGGCGTG